MTRDDYLALLRRALATPHGVALDFDDWVKAERARGRLYRLRSALRRAGDTSFDDLSLVMKPFGGQSQLDRIRQSFAASSRQTDQYKELQLQKA